MHYEPSRRIVRLVALLGLGVSACGCTLHRNNLPNEPIVVGGTSGSGTSGTQFLTIHGSRPVSTRYDPILSVAHVHLAPDPSLEASLRSASGGNTPDRFIYTGQHTFTVGGSPFLVEMTVDGRQHTFSAGGTTFALADGNFFRIRIAPDRSIQASQLPVFDVLERDHEKVKAIFRAHPQARDR